MFSISHHYQRSLWLSLIVVVVVVHERRNNEPNFCWGMTLNNNKNMTLYPFGKIWIWRWQQWTKQTTPTYFSLYEYMPSHMWGGSVLVRVCVNLCVYIDNDMTAVVRYDMAPGCSRTNKATIMCNVENAFRLSMKISKNEDEPGRVWIGNIDRLSCVLL